jgi:hypothetical protein
MEDLVRQVGHQSGRWGSKLYPSEQGKRPSNDDKSTNLTMSDDTISQNSVIQSHPIKRKSKSRKLEQPWIPNLIAVPLGEKMEDVNHLSPSHEDFAIQGTIAHIQCRILSIQTSTSKPNNPSEEILTETVDDDHVLVFGQVIKAYVHENYWDTTKNLFRPRNDTVAPYLTFFGSQTFGYIL